MKRIQYGHWEAGASEDRLIHDAMIGKEYMIVPNFQVSYKEGVQGEAKKVVKALCKKKVFIM